MEALQIAGEHIGQPYRERLCPEGYAVCVIGAGTAGISASNYLAHEGIAVTLVDKENKVGGTVRSGFSPWSQRERFLHELEEDVAGNPLIRLITGVEVGKDIEMTELADAYPAVIIATGLQQDHMLNLGGSEKYLGKGIVTHSSFRGIFNRLSDNSFNWPAIPGELIPGSSKPPLELMDGAMILGSGRNTIETAKSLTAWTVAERFRQAGIHVTPAQVIEIGLENMLQSVGAHTIQEIGLRGPTILTRNSLGDMTIMNAARHVTDEAKKDQIRAYTRRAVQEAAIKYGFNILDNKVISEIIPTNEGEVMAIVSRDTVEDGESLRSYCTHETRLIVPCLGSKFVHLDEAVEARENVVKIGSAARVPGGYNHMRRSGIEGAWHVLHLLHEKSELGESGVASITSIEAKLSSKMA